MVQRTQPSEFTCRSRNLERFILLSFLQINYDIVSAIHPRIINSKALQGAHDHLGMFVSIENFARANDAVIHIPLIVEHGSSSRASADEIPFLSIECREVYFCPGILISSYDDAIGICIEEEDCGIFGSFLQKIVLDREVEVGRETARDIDLRF